MKKVSIIIPIYNAAAWLHECIDSILSQSFQDFELLLIDDGSIDNSGEICDWYHQKDGRVFVLHKENSGVSDARNDALENASGEWLLFVDADDILLPNALTVLYNAAILNRVDVVLGGSNVIVNNKEYPYHHYDLLKSDNVINYMNHPALWSYLIRASIIKKNRIRFISGLAYSEDTIFLATIAIKANGIAYIPECVYIYRRNDTSACAVKDGVMTSGHMFHAAYELKLLADAETDKAKRRFLRKKLKMLIRGGCWDFASLSFSFKNYPQYERQYLRYFDGRIGLFVMTLNARIICIRRKYIRFRDNPLTGQKGLLPNVKSIMSFDFIKSYCKRLLQ